jgi:hypothetical protein
MDRGKERGPVRISGQQATNAQLLHAAKFPIQIQRTQGRMHSSTRNLPKHRRQIGPRGSHNPVGGADGIEESPPLHGTHAIGGGQHPLRAWNLGWLSWHVATVPARGSPPG